MIDTAFLSQLDRFSLVVRKRVTSSFTGQRKVSLSVKEYHFKIIEFMPQEMILEE